MGGGALNHYTPVMLHAEATEYQCRDLRIRPSTGQLMHADGRSISLGPVNMKVLDMLAAHAGQVVSRGEIYQAVWGNQIIGDGALTRCISDIRAELRNFSGRDDWIETLPKRGYRWNPEVSTVAGADTAPEHQEASDAGSQVPARPGLRRRLFFLALRGLVYLVLLLIIASGVVSLMDRLTDSRGAVIAVLPLADSTQSTSLASGLDVALQRFVAGLDAVRILSPSAIESKPTNPFPYFYYEFGARWLVESELRYVSGEPSLTVTVADARTGIVETRVTVPLSDPTSVDPAQLATQLDDLRRFFATEQPD